MRERPIIFSTPMVQAIRDCRKTQTRRIVHRPLKHPGWTGYSYYPLSAIAIENGPDYPDTDDDVILCPYGRAGDRLWVREAFSPFFLRTEHSNGCLYRADDDGYQINPGSMKGNWKPSIHMPRWASRITLLITAIGIEQLQDISNDDAAAEGWPGPDAAGSIRSSYPIAWYSHLWDSINGKRAPWASNPWVWVVSFRTEGEKNA